MYKDLTTIEEVVIDPSTSPARVGKPISKIYDVAFRDDAVVITGRFEGDASMTWISNYTREELPTDEAKSLYDGVVFAVNSLHESIRKQDANYGTSEWIVIEEE